MGAMKDAATTRREGPKGKSSNVDWSQVGASMPGGGVAWSDADDSAVAALVDAATRRGMAVSFSAASSGKGVSITILDGPNRPKFYANTPNELQAVLFDLTAKILA